MLAIFSSASAKMLSVVAIFFYLQVLVKISSALVLFSSVVAKISSVLVEHYVYCKSPTQIFPTKTTPLMVLILFRKK